jgi:hypothetical protein
MTFRPTSFLAGLAAMAGLWAFPAWAQPTIQLPKPAEEVTEKADSLMTPDQRKAADAYNAPKSLFSDQPGSESDFLPGAGQTRDISPAAAQQWQKFLDGKKKWMLMTPEEIMSLPTPDKILGLPDKSGDDKLTLEQRFLARQERAANFAATNGIRRLNDPWSRDNPGPFGQKVDTDREARPGDRPDAGSAKFYIQTLSAQPGPLFGSLPNEDSKWASAFVQPKQTPKQTPEQLAGMERFRALMEPSAPPDKLVVSRVPVVPAVDPLLEPVPQFNPNGRSFTPLQSSINRPTGIKPLPGIMGSYMVPMETKAAGKAQLPPWLSDSQQPALGMPQRKF